MLGKELLFVEQPPNETADRADAGARTQSEPSANDIAITYTAALQYTAFRTTARGPAEITPWSCLMSTVAEP